MADGERVERGARGLKILILAVGKAARPEKELCERYVARAQPLARKMGVSGLSVREVADAGPSSRAEVEGQRLLARRPAGRLVVLDETGESWTSERLARNLQNWADGGTRNVTFLIGGADGHGEAVRAAADDILSLGAMTLPHQLARVILLEQIYRAFTLCIGHPYHRS